MFGKVIMTLHRALLLVALTVALVATGFAHKMPSAADQSLALALANGLTLDDLCGKGDGGEQHRGPDCLACQIAAGADLPPVSGDLQKLELVFLAEVTAPRESRAVARILDPAHGMRAPPLA